MTNEAVSQKPSFDRLLIGTAWAVILLISDLPNVILNTLGEEPFPDWLRWAKVGVLVVFLLLCLGWRRLRLLWPYAAVMLALFLALIASDWVAGLDGYRRLFAGPETNATRTNAAFSLSYLKFAVRDIGVALAVLIVLWLIKRRCSDMFMVCGQYSAPIEPVRWLGIGKGESWKTFGWIFTIAAALLVAIPTILGISPTGAAFVRALPLLPVAILLAAINAFTEESYFRASLLSTLPRVVGRTHALLIAIVFFGLAHWLAGSPGAIVGFAMTGFLAFLLGKAMLETKGFLWPWIIHFVSDVVVFFSYALLWVMD